MIDLTIHTQPDDETCGPTCLHAIYEYFGIELPLDNVVKTVERSMSGGTLAPLLGKHALERGFETRIYINNVDVFDPTWFDQGESTREVLSAKLASQLKYKSDNKGVAQSSKAYLEYLHLGGEVRFQTLSVQILKRYFEQKIPILTGLSATYLYGSAREVFTPEGVACYDDIRGTPCGHFVVLCGYDEQHRHVVVADPHRENPLSHNNYYKVSINRLINAILIGVLTYDANLLIIQPSRKINANPARH